jgi:hypothetical protein
LARFLCLLFFLAGAWVISVVPSGNCLKIRLPILPRRPLMVPLKITLVMFAPFWRLCIHEWFGLGQALAKDWPGPVKGIL